MSIFDFIRRLLGGTSAQAGACPQCGFQYSWNGRRCQHCQYDRTAGDPRMAVDSQPGKAEITAPVPPIKSKTMQGLDVDKFAPISTEQALAATGKADWKTAYWDPMNVIPSAELPRIRVINQTMVGLGLISAAELAEIHAIGAEFDKYRTDRAIVDRAGAIAVAQSREQRAALKQQKKEEAAARKKAHAEAVALRKKTDIVFLGRGVSKGLADRRSHVERLQEKDLPLLSSPKDVADALAIDIPKLRWLAFHNVAARRSHYVRFEVPKKSGGVRLLSAPLPLLAKCQRWIHENILEQMTVSETAHGFVRERSIVTNAEPHVGADVVVNMDLKDFFPSISFWRIEGLFRKMGYSPAVATVLGLLCTECPRESVRFRGQPYFVSTGKRALPQGACTSPTLSNLVAAHLDLRLSKLATRMNWKVTRYADDISFSTTVRKNEQGLEQIGYMIARVRHIAQDEGFEVNEKKTRVQRNNNQQSVTGVVVNDRMGISRKKVRKLRAILHNAKKTGVEAQNREGRENFVDWLAGMISFVEMVNEQQGRALRTEFEALMAR